MIGAKPRIASWTIEPAPVKAFVSNGGLFALLLFSVRMPRIATTPEMNHLNKARTLFILPFLPSIHAGQPALNPGTVVQVRTAKQLLQVFFVTTGSTIEPN